QVVVGARPPVHAPVVAADTRRLSARHDVRARARGVHRPCDGARHLVTPGVVSARATDRSCRRGSPHRRARSFGSIHFLVLITFIAGAMPSTTSFSIAVHTRSSTPGSSAASIESKF